MATLTIRDLDDEVRRRLRVRAAEKGVSMEAEVRAILTDAVATMEPEPPGEWLRRIRARVEEIGGMDDAIALIPDRKEWPDSRPNPLGDAG